MDGKAERIPLEQLGKAVDSAVQMAVERGRIEAELSSMKSDFQRVPPWIIGRRIRGEVGPEQAFEFAKEVTARVADETGTTLVPTVSIFDDVILCGFIERFGDKFPVPSFLAGPGL
jgi:hypothetical protein